jgi:uncharacterized protein YecT (DUF1311 family)
MRRFKVFWILLVFILFILPVKGFSEEKEKKHPIDVWLESCIEKNWTTAGMRMCTSQALDKWDKELNMVYKELIKKLSPEEKELLNQSQLQWIKFRDAEFKWISGLYLGIGTNIPLEKMSIMLDIVKERVKMLKEYLELVKGYDIDRKERFKEFK